MVPLCCKAINTTDFYLFAFFSIDVVLLFFIFLKKEMVVSHIIFIPLEAEIQISFFPWMLISVETSKTKK